MAMARLHEDASTIEVDGANCPWCLNEALDRVRSLDGVTGVESSMAAGCIYVVHPGVDVGTVLETLRSSLHEAGTGPESQMLPLEPERSAHECRHGRKRSEMEPRIAAQDVGMMETLTDAMNRLRGDGYLTDFSATADGKLRCGACGVEELPEEMSIHSTVRFEGESNPADESILIALACACGCLGQYTAAYGPDTPHEDAAVLERLSRL